MIRLLVLSVAAAAATAAPSMATVAAPSIVDLSKAPKVGTTNKNYASWTIDSSYNRGFVHTDFSNINLLAAATDLAPSTIRFGGGGNDYLSYQPYSGCNSLADNDTFVCLNSSHFGKLHDMAVNSGTDFIFGVSYDMVTACNENSAYVWKPDAALAMVKSIVAAKQKIWGFE